jgi:hypothetical protein
VALAVVAYVPFLLSARGRVSADTKQYLYLDPGRLLADAPYLWDGGYGAGSVTHQNIGYLFPMGPYYWLMEQVGMPDWVAQRLWLGSISFAAGAGVLFLLSTLGWKSRWTALAAAFVYMLTPYQLAYTGRISAILLPWAALPFMVALTARAVRRGGWRDPAWFALVTLVVGSTNATSLLLVGIAPALWLVFAVLLGDAGARQAVQTALRIGALVVATSLWWMGGLVLQGGYGINYLDVSETVRTVAEGSSPIEVLRGLGNWFFYGGDAVGPWISQAVDLTQRPWLLAASFALPLLAFAATAVTRWRYRAYFVTVLVVGTVAAVGAFPYDDPSPIGGLFKSWATGSTAGLAMRSTPRAVPLVALAAAVLIGAGLEALTRATSRRLSARTLGLVRIGAVVVVIGLAFVELAPVWRDGYIAERNSREEDVPAYWTDAAAALDREGSETRVLEIPGSPSAAYRWGTTSDPITPGLIDRPWVARELIPYFGSPAAANLFIALDHRIQEGTFEPDSLAPIARMLNSGTVLLRSDLEYERSDTPRPRELWAALTHPRPSGLGAPDAFGDAVPNVATRFPLVDEIELRTPSDAPWPPPVALFPVTDPPSILSTAPTEQPVLVAGDGEALVDLAAAGLLDGSELVLYAGSYADDPAGLRDALDHGADLVLSDTNRRRSRRWGAIRDITGVTERAGEEPVEEDPEDKRLEVFPGSDDSDRTVVEQGGVEPAATAYGDTSLLFPDQRAAAAFDGDLDTAWRVGGDDDPRGERLIVEPREPVRTSSVLLTQPREVDGTRFITKARLHFGGGETIDVDLGDQSRTPRGQGLTFPERSIDRLEIEVLETNTGDLAGYGGQNAVGFAEVGIGGPGALADEVVRLPTRLLEQAGAESLDHRLVVMMSRLGYEPASRRRDAEERSMARVFELPAGRAFSLSGRARVAPNAPDPVLDTVLGTTAPGAVYDASGHLRGDAGARASRAFDDDPATAWIAPMGANVEQVGQWVDVATADPLTIDRMDLEIVADGKHSVPTRLRLEVDGEAARTVDVPAISDGATDGATTAVPVTFEPVTGRTFRLVVDEVRPVTTTDARTQRQVMLPVAIAETGMPGVPVPAAPATIPATCRTGLVTVDGDPVGVQVAGDRSSAESHRGLDLVLCDATAVDLAKGEHVVRSMPGLQTGLDADRLVLASDRGGAPLAPEPLGARRDTAGATVRVTDDGPTSFDATVRTDGEPFWLVLGQSQSDGWELEVDGDATVSEQQLVNGYANGWTITPDGPGELTVRLRWAPQGLVWWAIGASVLALLVCLFLALRRRRDPGAASPAPVVPVVPVVASDATDGMPALMLSLSAGGARPSAPAVAVATGVMTVAAGVAARPWVGLVVGVATLVALVVPRARVVLTAGAVGALAIAAGYVVVQQARHGYPTISSWPSQFDAVTGVTWLALWLLAADVVVRWVRDRAGRDRSAPS